MGRQYVGIDLHWSDQGLTDTDSLGSCSIA